MTRLHSIHARDRLALLPRGPAVGITEALVLIAPVAGIAGLLFYLGRGRARIMRYHDIPTPRINEMTHGGGDSG